jgi:hypothetical protein
MAAMEGTSSVREDGSSEGYDTPHETVDVDLEEGATVDSSTTHGEEYIDDSILLRNLLLLAAGCLPPGEENCCGLKDARLVVLGYDDPAIEDAYQAYHSQTRLTGTLMVRDPPPFSHLGPRGGDWAGPRGGGRGGGPPMRMRLILRDLTTAFISRCRS